jgi:hypothetical protein
MMSLILGFFGTARIGSVGLEGLASLLQAHAQHDFDRRILQQGE